MTKDQYRAIYDRYTEAWNRRDLALTDALTDEFFAPDAVIHFGNGPVPKLEPGPAGQKQFERMVLGENPDYHGIINDFLADGDKTFTRMTMQMNDPETHEVISFSAVFLDRWVDGKIAESWRMGAPGKW